MAKKKSDNKTTAKTNKNSRPERVDVRTDVLGSYTGTGENGDEPVQDADDL